MIKPRFLISGILLLVAIGIVLANSYFGLKPKKILIKTQVENTTIHYEKKSFWNVVGFSNILKSQEKFKLDQISEFKKGLRYGASASNCKIEINELKKSTILRCDVNNVISKYGDSYTAEFEWLLNPLRLDFLDNNFKRSEDMLSWEGKIEGIPTAIILNFPAPINNCHAHVWWSKE
ncbi:MAG: hypothetical protein AMJ45_06520 [Syntrophobacter sp. DG_60]|nr:MAG: hypothetical protein AMJ45_06520 [Syntrophobacter sp. DG_60]